MLVDTQYMNRTETTQTTQKETKTMRRLPTETTRGIITTTPCPYCKADAGQPCSRPGIFKGPDQPMTVVHDQRRQAAATRAARRAAQGPAR